MEDGLFIRLDRVVIKSCGQSFSRCSSSEKDVRATTGMAAKMNLPSCFTSSYPSITGMTMSETTRSK